MEKLKNDADGLPAITGALGFRGVLEGDAIHQDFAGVWLVQGSQQVQQGAFSTATGPGDGGHAASFQVQRDVMERLDLSSIGLAVSARHVADFDHEGVTGEPAEKVTGSNEHPIDYGLVKLNTFFPENRYPICSNFFKASTV
jgi:hypothetical protein